MAVILPDRSVLSARGAEARAFLQGLFTCDMDEVSAERAGFGGLLTPQGKLLFDFFIIEQDDGFLLDAPKSIAAALRDRLNFYKLRAKIAIDALADDGPDAYVVCAFLNEEPPREAIGFEDPRSKKLGWRALGPKRLFGQFAPASLLDYHRRRIDAGAPMGGVDFAYGEVFPTDANMDLLHGVAFDKGCYVGQEVVSRMKHRGLIRRRALRVSFTGPEPAQGAEIRAQNALIGEMGGVAERKGLALIRIDRLAEAGAAPLLCGDALVRVEPNEDILNGA